MEWVNGNYPGHDIKPCIKFCDTPDDSRLLRAGVNSISSYPSKGIVGRRLSYFINDDRTGYTLGLVTLSSDLLFIKPRDTYIGWSLKQRFATLQNLVFVHTCIATPPLNNYLTGKLAALSILSSEVVNKWESKYPDKIAGYTCTSIHGKSSIYNRLKQYIYVGLTKGYSAKELKVKKENAFVNITSRLRFANNVRDQYTGIDTTSNKRGVYLIPLGNYKEFLLGKEDLQRESLSDFSGIVEFWKGRWYYPRIERIGKL